MTRAEEVSIPPAEDAGPVTATEDVAVVEDIGRTHGGLDAATPSETTAAPDTAVPRRPEPDAVTDVAEPEPVVSCGDGVCDIDETCASCALDCPICRPGAGEVIITEIMQNPQAVTDEHGEWFEVLNLTDGPLSLQGVRLRDAGADAYVIAGPLVVEGGGIALLASSVDLGAGLAADHVWSGFYLGNATDEVILEYGGVLIDAVAYDGGTAWPDPTGASMALDLIAQDATSNDDGARWCEGIVAYGAGDLGSPGAPNLVCGAPPPSVCGDGTCADDEGCLGCEVDCGLCPCADGQIYDCLGGCIDAAALGDGGCDDGLDCLDHGFDGGDCLEPGCGAALFFSEYIEGSSHHKGVEIYNPTGQPIDLSDYAIWKITNGGLWADEDLDITPLEGVLEPGDVYVACHTGLDANPAVAGICDAVSGGAPTNFNGDDALGLAHMGTLIDVIGAEGEDPGTGWEMDGTTHATKDHTLVRAPSVTAGVADWTTAIGTWQIFETDHFDGLGSHEVSLSCDPTAGQD
ncbi:MAG: lamin tail domain-containing protein [Myxococcota bacterium]|nr:lamin tail domain-containing protein [Myxococcota bacterium]